MFRSIFIPRNEHLTVALRYQSLYLDYHTVDCDVVSYMQSLTM